MRVEADLRALIPRKGPGVVEAPYSVGLDLFNGKEIRVGLRDITVVSASAPGVPSRYYRDRAGCDLSAPDGEPCWLGALAPPSDGFCLCGVCPPEPGFTPGSSPGMTGFS